MWCILSNSFKKTAYWLIFFLVILWWNYCQPLTADDYSYAFTNSLSRGNLIHDITNRYLTWSGRISADFLVLLLLNQQTLNFMLPLVNALSALAVVFILHYLTIILYGRQYKLSNASLVSAIYIIFFVASATYAQNFMWKTVAIQYGWGMALVLGLIVNHYLPSCPKYSVANTYIMRGGYFLSLLFYAISGVFIGLYNEIYVAFIIAFFTSCMLVSWQFKLSFNWLRNWRLWIFLLALTIAGIVSICAPGNFIRRATYFANSSVGAAHYGYLYKIFMTYVQFFRYGYHVIFALVIVYVIVWLLRNRQKIIRHDYIMLNFLILLLNLQILSFVEVAYYSPIAGRMLIFIDTTLFLILYKFLQIRYHPNNLISKVSLGKYYLPHALLLVVCVVLTTSYYQFHQFIIKRQSMVTAAVNEISHQPLADDYKASLNPLVRYIVYFDTMRTSDYDFTHLYHLNQRN